MAVNKVIINNDTVVDLTDTTASTDSVAAGRVFYSADGSRSVGVYEPDHLLLNNVQQSADTLHPAKTFSVELYADGSDYNLPTSLSYYIQTLQSSSVDFGTVQLALGFNTEGVYYRRLTGSGWTDWYDLMRPNLLGIANGGTGATNRADARTNLGLGTVATLNTVPVANGGTGATDAATARTNLGLGTVATLNTVPVANGGTGATDAATARTNLISTGFPNYSSRQVLHSGTTTDTSNITYSGTVSSNGFLQAYISTNSSNGLPFMRLSIQNQNIYELGKYGNATATNYMYRWSPLFPVRSGDAYSFALGASVSGASLRVFFYPDR